MKGLVTGFLLWAALHRVPMHGIRTALLLVRPWPTLLSLGFFVAGAVLVESTRFACASHLLDERQPRFRDWARFFVESRPFFYLLPASIGTEGMVWARLRQYQWHHVSCGFVVVNTRLWGFAAWAGAAAFALSEPSGAGTLLARAPAWMRAPGIWAAAAVLAAAAAAAVPAAMARWNGLALRRAIGLPNLAMALASSASALIISRAVVMASAAAGTPIPFHAAMGLMAIFNFAMVLPVSLAGFGLQEALVLILGHAYGYQPASLVAFSAILHLQRLALSLPGLGIFLAGRWTLEHGAPTEWTAGSVAPRRSTVD
jgi:hypothetical protein